MQCPHCSANLLYKERGGRCCRKCKQRFAFEPKTSPLKLHDLRFQRVVEKISANGTIWYTPAQLHHALARKAVTEQKRRFGIIGCFSIIVAGVAIGVASDVSRSVFILTMILCIGLVFLLIGVQQTRPFYRKLPVSPEDFSRRVLDEWRKTYNMLPRGLMTADHPAHSSEYALSPAQLKAVLVCPQRDILLFLKANGIPQQYNMGLLPTEGPFTPAEETLLTTLRARPDLPLLLLHDASLSGVLLSQTIGMSLGVSSGHRIVDLGLRPSHVLQHKLMQLGAKPPPELLSILTRRMHNTIASGAPLSAEEFDWLKKGNYSPILAVSPVRLLRVVINAMTKHSQPLPPSKEVGPEQQAQKQAQAVGFMSWPQ
ncbi:MAG: hypothetical protein GFH27_549281n78 [Chloroflexi bacterium AL-W]|nr:hypothetical protein [Chloroflexi bacterium AL-N1]NOK65964.1 hypothetical protein [Chloroflexi bacterium AL-N10]NOK72845.1 hypothetical protein [Chloroflexi bacterium AL-N5]NOK79742.1 hypothetical protein [Chloroflexi bacterium AL-W]NOK88402.1 hypothetical protein [Chloroflexi bacterium AL-N15]